MQIAIADILTAPEVASTRQTLATTLFVDGKATAGWAVRDVKANQQANASPEVVVLADMLSQRIAVHPVFELAVRPKRLVSLLFAKYSPGDAYGTHVDNAIMAGVRTDVSFTLFLSDPESYDGGELVIEQAAGEDAIKLAAGSLIAYPSSSLHRVAPVTRGERLVLVGWARSFVRDPARRELLFDLETARRRLHDRLGKTPEGDLLAKCAGNLLRSWVDD